MENCKTCIYWEFTHEDYPYNFGVCSSLTFTNRIRVTLEDGDEELTIFTEALNGCPFHDGKELMATEIEFRES